jgi:putative spermidine/putrescine transport system permease protein
VVAIFVSGTHAATLPKQMWDGIRTEIDPTVAAVSTLLIAVTTLALGLLALVRRRAERL